MKIRITNLNNIVLHILRYFLCVHFNIAEEERGIDDELRNKHMLITNLRNLIIDI